MKITDLILNGTVRFVKRYPEYVLDKVGIVISINISDGIVLIRTDNKTIYKLIFADAEFEIVSTKQYKR